MNVCTLILLPEMEFPQALNILNLSYHRYNALDYTLLELIGLRAGITNVSGRGIAPSILDLLQSLVNLVQGHT